MLNISNNLEIKNAPTLNTSLTFIAEPCIISETNLFNLIENYYNEKNIDKVKNLYELYKNYKYEKNLDKIEQFLEN